jgi:hypothetical protein
MITRAEAQDIVTCFSGLHFYPKAEQAISVLIDAVERSVTDKDHGKRLVSQWLEDQECGMNCPTPADIRRIAWATKPDTDERPDCPKCHGTGFKYTMIDGVEHAKKCECRP